MADLMLNSNGTLTKDRSGPFILLSKDQKSISRVQCLQLHFEVPSMWEISEIARKSKVPSLTHLPHCFLRPAYQSHRDQKEWRAFLNFLLKHNMVAIVKLEVCKFYILPPDEQLDISYVMAKIWMERAKDTNKFAKPGRSVGDESCPGSTEDISMRKTAQTPEVYGFVGQNMVSDNSYMGCSVGPPVEEAFTRTSNAVEGFADKSDVYMMGRASAICADKCSPNQNIRQHPVPEYKVEMSGRVQPVAVRDNFFQKNFVRADPTYLRTLGQAHSGWVFGAIAELVDNSRDAKASKMDIFIEMIHSKRHGKNIPMLSLIDDGHGMTHEEIVRMTSFGHKQADIDDPDCIGKFGVGFKTGAMRLGRDALVFTQTSDSRSIAFLSQSLNEGKDNLEIPIVSYSRRGCLMELDTRFQPEDLAKYNLKAIKEFSPFNKYLIGEKASLFSEKGTGTQVYIWNLDEWGSDYSLEWQAGKKCSSSFHQGDILTRSRRIRSRPGQISQKVPLDYSLRAYLEVIFLDPRMRICVQGSPVKSRPLAKYLNKTHVENGYIMGKHVQLTIGRSQLEWEQANCGMFLYWHGRLIEAYKRVGGMIHNGDMGRGVIGVVDVTHLMNNGNGRVWVHSNKQGFQDCEQYARLEDWLGNIADKYWDKNFDNLDLRKNNGQYKPDHDWVQCDKCRKWRMLPSDFDTRELDSEWFCYKKPFEGLCDIPEQKAERGVITISAKRSTHDPTQVPTDCKAATLVNSSSMSGNGDDDSSQTVEEVKLPTLKRLRRGPSRVCKKG